MDPEPPEQLELFPPPQPDSALPHGSALGPHTYALSTGQVSHCRSCGAAIVWTTNPVSGARIPLSLATKRWRGGCWVATSHFLDCAHASAWGKRGGHGQP